MNHWRDARRYNAAFQEQMRINDDMAEKARSESKNGGNHGMFLFMLVVIFSKPIAEYFIELYVSIASYVHSISSQVGF